MAELNAARRHPVRLAFHEEAGIPRRSESRRWRVPPPGGGFAEIDPGAARMSSLWRISQFSPAMAPSPVRARASAFAVALLPIPGGPLSRIRVPGRRRRKSRAPRLAGPVRAALADSIARAESMPSSASSARSASPSIRARCRRIETRWCRRGCSGTVGQTIKGPAQGRHGRHSRHSPALMQQPRQEPASRRSRQGRAATRAGRLPRS